MKEQFIHIDEIGNKRYYSDSSMLVIHREDGPAIEYATGEKFYCLKNKMLTKKEFIKQTISNQIKSNKKSYEEMIIEVDGDKYKLVKT